MSEVLDDRTAEVWDEARQQHGGQTHKIVDGEFNRVLLVDPSPDCSEASYVVKIAVDNPEARAMLDFEARVVQHINRPEAGPSPVVIPELYAHDPDAGYAVLSFVPGQILQQAEAYNFSDEDRQAVGQKFGEFVLWCASTITPEAYDRLEPPHLPNREQFLRQYAADLRTADQAGFPTLQHFSMLVLEVYDDYNSGGWIEPKIIGHDDLRLPNITFGRAEDHWDLHGVFDFGITQPSTVAREMRHAVALGRPLAHIAIQLYAQRNRQHLPKGDVLLTEDIATNWAEIQAATNTIARLQEGNPIGSVPLRLYKLHPHRNDADWSELGPHGLPSLDDRVCYLSKTGR